MSWAPVGHRGRARHAPAFASDGSAYLVPPLALCTGRESGRIESILPERIDCKRCLAILATIPTTKPERSAWMREHGADRQGRR